MVSPHLSVSISKGCRCVVRLKSAPVVPRWISLLVACSSSLSAVFMKWIPVDRWDSVVWITQSRSVSLQGDTVFRSSHFVCYFGQFHSQQPCVGLPAHLRGEPARISGVVLWGWTAGRSTERLLSHWMWPRCAPEPCASPAEAKIGLPVHVFKGRFLLASLPSPLSSFLPLTPPRHLHNSAAQSSYRLTRMQILALPPAGG